MRWGRRSQFRFRAAVFKRGQWSQSPVRLRGGAPVLFAGTAHGRAYTGFFQRDGAGLEAGFVTVNWERGESAWNPFSSVTETLTV